MTSEPRTIKGYEVRNYLEYQPSKAERDNANKAAAERMRRYKDNRHSDLMQHFRGFLSGPNRCPGCAGHGITDRGTTCKACLGDGKLTSAVRGRVEWFGGARLPEPDAPLVGGYWDQRGSAKTRK